MGTEVFAQRCGTDTWKHECEICTMSCTCYKTSPGSLLVGRIWEELGSHRQAGRKLPAACRAGLSSSQTTGVGCLRIFRDICTRGYFIVVLNRDFICCLRGPGFLICKTKGLGNVILKVFSASFSGLIYTLKKKKKSLSNPTSSLDLPP